MNINDAVEKLLYDKLVGKHQISKDLWLCCGCKPSYKDFTFLVSTCPGGAYSQFGSLRIGDDAVFLQLKTVWGIIRHCSELSKHRFEFCNPEFPDNLIEFVRLAAANSQRCFHLAHRRGWNHWKRNMIVVSSIK